MSDSSSTQMAYWPENNWGEDPAARSPQIALRELRFTSESLNRPQETTVSEEIRSDRQVADIVRVSAEAGGDVGIEFSFGAHDDLFEGAFYNDWTPEVEVNLGSPLTGTVTIGPGSPVALNQIQLTQSPISALTLANAPAGAFIRVGGSALSPTNDGFYQITANDGNGTLTVSPNFQAFESGTNLTIEISHLRNGTTPKSFLLEKQFTDVSAFHYFTGQRVGTAELNIAVGAILNGQFTFLGKTAVAQGTTIAATSPALVTVASNDVFNSVDNIGNVLLDGVAAAVNFTEISFSIDNALRNQPAIGQLEAVGIGIGRITVTGNLTAYFINNTFYNQYLNFDTVSLSFTVTLGSNVYLVHFPSFKFTNATVVAEGNDQDVLVNMDFTAKRDPTLGFTVGLNRFGTIPALVAA